MRFHPWPIPRPAGLWSRAMSKTVDCLVLSICLALVWLLGAAAGYRWLVTWWGLGSIGAEGAMEFVIREWITLSVTSLLLAVVYPMAMRSICGQTIGEAFWALRLYNREGGEATTGRIVKRGCLSIVSIVTLGAGYIWAFFDGQRQSLHGRLSGTYVARV